MKHNIIITTVGTSMFSNYKMNSQCQTSWDRIRKENYKDWNYFLEDIEEVQTAIESWGQFSCAEIDTIIEIKKEYGDNLEHHFLCSETIAGMLAGKILEKKLPNVKSVNFVEGLQTKISSKFKEKVFLNLIEKVHDIAKVYKVRHESFIKAINIFANNKNQKELALKNDVLLSFLTEVEVKELQSLVKNEAIEKAIKYKDEMTFNIVINISGGFKATIPYLTILGQIYSYDLAYVHEDGKELIDIKKLPLHFDVTLAEQFYPYLSVLAFKEEEKKSLIENESVKLSKENVLQQHLQIKEMKDYQLLDDKNEVTAFGNLILEYINETNAIGKSTLGYYCEYKMFEYFYEYHKNDYLKIERSFKPEIEKSKNPIDIGDADLLLEVEPNLYDWVEIKSFGQIFKIDKNGEWRVIQRIKDRFSSKFSNFEGSQIRNYKFIVYKYESDDLSLVSDIIQKMKTEFSNVQVYYFTVKLNILNKDKNPFSSFMQYKMDEIDLIQL
jgi:CRISPR/Cas system-associated protein Csm6